MAELVKERRIGYIVLNLAILILVVLIILQNKESEPLKICGDFGILNK